MEVNTVSPVAIATAGAAGHHACHQPVASEARKDAGAGQAGA